MIRRELFEGLTTWIVEAMNLLESFNVSLSERVHISNHTYYITPIEIPLLYHLIIGYRILFQSAHKTLAGSVLPQNPEGSDMRNM